MLNDWTNEVRGKQVTLLTVLHKIIIRSVCRESASRGAAMRRNQYLKNIMTQFSYEHKKFEQHLTKVQKSAADLGKMLDDMSGKEKKNEEK